MGDIHPPRAGRFRAENAQPSFETRQVGRSKGVSNPGRARARSGQKHRRVVIQVNEELWLILIVRAAGDARSVLACRHQSQEGSDLMAKLPKFTLSKNRTSDRWELVNSADKSTVESYARKTDALKGGAISKAIGGRGSVRIKKQDGKIQEERTFPRSADPRRSKG